MTKKHYTAIAVILKNSREYRDISDMAHYKIADSLASYFALDNKNFDRTRFLQVCGITELKCSHKNCNNVVQESGDECRTCYDTK